LTDHADRRLSIIQACGGSQFHLSPLELKQHTIYVILRVALPKPFYVLNPEHK
jgi:hypothetical protein